MAHQLDTSNGRNNMAYVGETPWHGLGQKISADASKAEVQTAAGLDFEIKKAPISMTLEDGTSIAVPEMNRSVLYRSDTNAPLSIMSTNGFHIVQPEEIVSFIFDTVEAMGWKIETAGSLRGGRKVWALANIGEEATIGTGDTVKGYLLAATGCDGTMASEFKFTTVRVVCHNTLDMAVGRGADGSQPKVKVYHFNKFDVNSVKKQLGIATSQWAAFVETAKVLSKVKLSAPKALKVLRSVYMPDEKLIDGVALTDDEFLKQNTSAKRVLELFDGAGIGSDLASSKMTAWGLVNAQTEFCDHASKTFSRDNRLNTSWFGKGVSIKQAMVDACLDLA